LSKATVEEDPFKYTVECDQVTRKAAWGLKYTQSLTDPNFHTGTPENDQRLLRNLNHVDTKVQVHRFITQDVLELLSNTVHLVTTTHTQLLCT
jgi:hypothetical protein